MKPELDFATKSSTHPTSTSNSLIVLPENKLIEKSQTVSPDNFQLTVEKKYQFTKLLKKLQIFQRGKFSDILLIKSKIIPSSESPVTCARKSQMLSQDKPKISDKEISQVKNFQPCAAKQELHSEEKLQVIHSNGRDVTYIKIPKETVPKKDSQVASRSESRVRNAQLPTSRKPETTHFKIVQVTSKKRTEESPSESIVVPTQKHQITHLKESEGTIMKESIYSSSSEKEIQVDSLQESETIHSKS